MPSLPALRPPVWYQGTGTSPQERDKDIEIRTRHPEEGTPRCRAWLSPWGRKERVNPEAMPRSRPTALPLPVAWLNGELAVPVLRALN